MSKQCAAAWLLDAKRHVKEARQCLGQVYDAAAQAKLDLTGIPHGYTLAGSRRFIEAGGRTTQLEDAEDECVRLMNALQALSFEDLESCEVDKIERWAAEAVGGFDASRG